MRISAASAFLALSLCLCAPAAFGQQPPASPAGDKPTAAPAKPAPAPASSARSDAAEARYRDWVEKEHAKDAAVFAKEKTKIEDKYKGYVRPKREKKDAKGEPSTPPAKGN